MTGDYGSVPKSGAATNTASIKTQDDFGIGYATCVVLGVIVCDALATSTFDGTQAVFLDNLQIDSRLNNGMKFARERVYMVFLLLCGKLGDCSMGRFDTIVLGAVVYFGGTMMVALAQHPWMSRRIWYMAGAFLVFPFSQAAINANISIFGGDQFVVEDEPHDAAAEGGGLVAARDRFFWWVGMAKEAGAAVAYMLLASYGIRSGFSEYLVNDVWEQPPVTMEGEATSYYTAFVGSCAIFICGAGFFMYGRSCFSAKSFELLPSSSVVGLTQYLVKISSHCSLRGITLLVAKVIGITVYIGQAVLFWSPDLSAPLSYCSAVGVAFSVLGIILFCRNVDWIDDSVEQLDEQPLPIAHVKDFLQLLPFIVCSQISYGCLVVVMKTWYTRQACQMDLRYFRSETYIGAPQMFVGFFELFTAGVVVVTTPFVVFWVNPYIHYAFKRVGHDFTDWTKYLVGLAFGLLSVIMAALIEIIRRDSPNLYHASDCSPRGVGVKSMSGYWMLLPCTLMGICTTYVVPSLWKISYCQVPRTMRSLTTITNIFMQSASQSMVITVSLALQEYTPHNLDTGHLEYLYYTVIGLSLTLLAVFACLLPYYKEKSYDDTGVGVQSHVA